MTYFDFLFNHTPSIWYPPYYLVFHYKTEIMKWTKTRDSASLIRATHELSYFFCLNYRIAKHIKVIIRYQWLGTSASEAELPLAGVCFTLTSANFDRIISGHDVSLREMEWPGQGIFPSHVHVSVTISRLMADLHPV